MTPAAETPATPDLAPLRGAAAWRAPEIVFWLIPLLAYFLFPKSLALLSQIAITALFALSIDLILGYAGIVSLGHAAFFGLGAYTVGILARNGLGDPLMGLAAAAGIAGLVGFATSFLVLRGSDLTRLMITLGVASLLYETANKLDWLTGGADGLQGMVIEPILGRFSFDLYGTTAYLYALTVLFVVVLGLRVLVHSPFGHALRAIRDNPLRARAIGIPVNRRLVAAYTLAAAIAGIAGALLAQTSGFASLDVLEFHRSADVMLVLVIGGTGRLYGGILGAILFRFAQDGIATLTPQYWQFWIGLGLVVLVLAGRQRMEAGVRRAIGRIWPGSRETEAGR